MYNKKDKRVRMSDNLISDVSKAVDKRMEMAIKPMKNSKFKKRLCR